MNTKLFTKKALAVGIAGVLAVSLSACGSTGTTNTQDIVDAATATPTAEATVNPEATATPEPVVTEAPSVEDENRWNIPVEDIQVNPEVDEAYGDGEGQLAARDALVGLSALIAEDRTLWSAHTEEDEARALVGWVDILTPEAYAEIEDDFQGSKNTITAGYDGLLVTVEGTDYMMPEGETVTWTATTGVAVNLTEDGDAVSVRFNASSDAPTTPRALSAEYEFNVIVIRGEDGFLIDDVQYTVPNGIEFAEAGE